GGSEFVEWKAASGGGTGCSEITTNPCNAFFTAVGEERTLNPEFALEAVQPPPTVENNAPGAITQSSIVMNGHVDNEGDAGGSSCKFVVALEATPGTPVAEPACDVDPVTGTANTAVEATATGLSPSTKYVYRVVATNTGGTTTGTPDQAAETSATWTLTINESGSGSGTVECEVDGGGLETCPSPIPDGSEVEVIATADTGSELAELSGAGSAAGECALETATEGSCAFTITENSAVTAEFVLETRKLTVSRSGSGSGSVASTPAGIECGADCEEEYDYGEAVELHQSAASGSHFVEWTGDCAGSGPCEVTMDAAHGVGATFALDPPPPVVTHSLTIDKVGPGSGSVSCNGGACASSYAEGTTVTLSAAADAGSTFYGWAGAGCSGAGDCVVTLNSDRAVTAAFEANPPAAQETGEEGGASRCARPARKAAALSNRAKKLRRNARRVARNGKFGKAKRLRRKAHRIGGRAQRLSRNAKRCRRSAGR
ncbi:MAG TPA: hypothetical protein VFT19_07255, partial [Solirubrobacterales bacterium]|nr:hypothetical protein [Solirubrobacterales bacterium]